MSEYGSNKYSVKSVIAALKETFNSFWYWLIALTVFSGVLAFAIWLPNLSFLKHVAVSSDYNGKQKLSLLVNSLGALNTNFTLLSRTLTIIVALLFAINIALVIFYLRKKINLQRSAGISIGGTLIGLIGIGCASCGSVLLTAVFGISTTAAFIGVLPLKGQEFGLLSIAILIFSIFLTAKKIENPGQCKIRKSKS